jgi:hypothetical protein
MIVFIAQPECDHHQAIRLNNRVTILALLEYSAFAWQSRRPVSVRKQAR